MIEAGEPLHIYFSVCFVVFIAFLLYLMCRDLIKAQKNSN